MFGLEYKATRIKMKPKQYKLPDGNKTSSPGRYVREWNKLTKPVAEALNCDIIGCDPSVHLVEKGGGHGFQISVSIAKRIKDLYLNRDYL
jgi:hypothetical protein